MRKQHYKERLYMDYVTAVILTTHAALVELSGLQPRESHIQMINELICITAESTPTTLDQNRSTLIWNDKGIVASPADSGYCSTRAVQPNATEESFESFPNML